MRFNNFTHIILALSLINRWDVITANLSSTLLQAPIASEELLLVEPAPELEQDPGVLWKLTRALYGIKPNPKLWQQYLASKHEELGPQEEHGRSIHLC